MVRVKKKKGAYFLPSHLYAVCNFDISLLPIKLNLPMVCQPLDWTSACQPGQKPITLSDLSGGYLSGPTGEMYDRYRLSPPVMGRWASPLEWYLLEEPVPACLSRPNSNLWSFGLRLKAGIKGMGSRLLYLLGMGSRKRAHDEWDPRQWHMRCGWWSCLLLVFSTQTQNQLRPWKQVA